MILAVVLGGDVNWCNSVHLTLEEASFSPFLWFFIDGLSTTENSAAAIRVMVLVLSREPEFSEPSCIFCQMDALVPSVATVLSMYYLGGTMGRALDLRSTGRGFKSYSRQKLHNHLGQVVHTYLPLSPSSITWYRPRGGNALVLGR